MLWNPGHFIKYQIMEQTASWRQEYPEGRTTS